MILILTVSSEEFIGIIALVSPHPLGGISGFSISASVRPCLRPALSLKLRVT